MNKIQRNIDDLMTGFKGCLIIGDVHGNKEQFDLAVSYATDNDLLLISLGDLVDYGNDVDYIVSHSYDLINQGRMIAVIGNHEHKLYRYFNQLNSGKVTLTVKPCLQKSIDALCSTVLINKFRYIYESMSYSIRFLNNIMVHGAAHHRLLQPESLCETQPNQPNTAKLTNYCLFGQVDREQQNNTTEYPIRMYDWIEKIPSNYTVFCGHDIISMVYPVKKDNTHFVDCGCGKEGKLFGAVLTCQGEFVTYVALSTKY